MSYVVCSCITSSTTGINCKVYVFCRRSGNNISIQCHVIPTVQNADLYVYFCKVISHLCRWGQELPLLTWFKTHLGRVTHICVSDITSIGSDNGLSPGRRQDIIRTNAGILLIRPLGTNFIEFLVEILIFSFKKMRLEVSSAKRRPFCLGLNELTGTTVWISNYSCCLSSGC